LEKEGKKTRQNGSVENLDPYQDHDVVREDFQSEFSSLAPRGAATDEGFEASLDHRHYGLDLNATAVGARSKRVCMSRRLRRCPRIHHSLVKSLKHRVTVVGQFICDHP
jgi:hypothetical protein